MKTTIVIPNRNGAIILQKNLPTVIAICKSSEIIVVDDASTDNSINVLQKEFPDVTVISKEYHEGYASTVNAGVAVATGEIVVLLNSDVRPEKNFLVPLVAHFRDPRMFAVGCMDKSIEGDNVILRGRGLAYWESGMYIHSRGEINKTDTAWVSGGSGAFRKSIWMELGGMDPLFNPFYWEDIDLSYRARKAGYTIFFESRSIVIHEHEKGIIKQEYSSSFVFTIAYRNQFLFIWKNLTDYNIIFEHILWTPIRLLQSLLSGNVNMLFGYLYALFRLPNVMISRTKIRRRWYKRDRDLATIQ